MTKTFKVQCTNGEPWTEDDIDMVFTDIAAIEKAVDEFIDSSQEAYTLELLDDPYTYDDVEVISFDAHGNKTSVQNYLDFMSEMNKDFNLSISI